MLVTAEADTEVQSAGTEEPVFMKHIQASNVWFFFYFEHSGESKTSEHSISSLHSTFC